MSERTPTFQIQPFGSYYLLERIAVGGMAEIFKAKQIGVRGFEKIVVIKKILHHLSEDPEFVEMFEDEAKIAAQLNQANIVQIYELGETDGVLYITMELVDGKNLRDITRAASTKGIHLSVEQAVMIMSEVLKGLDYAHRKTDSAGKPMTIIHRDMSPQNIIVSYEGEVKILDFGIAKAASKISRTEAGVLKGKFSYMSPEQASGKVVDQATDVYACGVIFHELLTSDRLFRARTDMETLERVKEGIVPPPSEKNPLVPKELDTIVLKALSKSLEDRYRTGTEFLMDLLKFQQETKVSYSSQDLSAFMHTLFQNIIADERTRLQEALARIPSSPTAQIQNAKTNIAFKRDTNAIGKIPLVPTSSDNTMTIDRASLMTPGKRRAYFGILVVTFLAGLFMLFGRRESPPVKFDEAAEVNEVKPVPAPPDTDVKRESPHQPRPGIIEETLPKVEEINPIVKNPKPRGVELVPDPRIENDIDEDDLAPPPRTRPPATKPKPQVSAQSNKPALPEKPGYLDVIAPPEGFANLYIDDRAHGTVPGPQARNIELKAGSHQIRCETPNKIYKGKITIRPDRKLKLRCQELR